MLSNIIHKNKFFRVFLFIALVTLLAVVLNIIKVYTYNRYVFFEIFWQKQIAMFIKAYLWVGLGLIIYFLSKKFPFKKEKKISFLVSYFLLGIFLSFFHYILFYGIAMIFVKFEVIRYRIYFSSIFMNFRYNIGIYWMLIGFSYAFQYYIKNRVNEQEKRKFAGIIERLMEKNNYLKKIPIKDGRQTIFLKTEKIILIEAAGDYINLHTETSSRLLYDSLTNIEQKLDPEEFLRIHRSYIINLDYIKEVRKNLKYGYSVILKNDRKLQVGKKYRNNLLNRTRI